ncbi:MAG TPA: cytochrome c [Vicinamibacterales bacterium]|nr:cytochrome c [Vicinamibacterales bacterium]
MHLRGWTFLLAVALVTLAVAVRGRSPWPRAIRAADARVPATAEARGRIVYERYGCALCHGADGKGGFANPNAETGGVVPGVVFVAEGYTRDELRRKILDGVATIGKADAEGPSPPFRMPGWAGYMTPGEVDDLVAYLLSLYPKDAASKWR